VKTARREWGSENEDLEVQLLLEAVFQKYGYDFRGYSLAHIKRRVLHRLALSDYHNISEMQHAVLTDRLFFESVLLDLSINFTEMFRDPPFYLALRNDIIPVLKTYPFIKVWNAGCSTGEETYSIAILLREEGMYERTQLYATDFNDVVLKKAKEAIYPADRIQEYTYNYQKAGGKESFADYYTAKYDSAILSSSLKDRILFSNHNLVLDKVFGEMHLILCRNVLIYFTRELQERVIELFLDSLCPGGFLCLGSKESLSLSRHAGAFETVDEKWRIYRKKLDE
jgi:chemotaxis protein methyltransferase CheR